MTGSEDAPSGRAHPWRAPCVGSDGDRADCTIIVTLKQTQIIMQIVDTSLIMAKESINCVNIKTHVFICSLTCELLLFYDYE